MPGAMYTLENGKNSNFEEIVLRCTSIKSRTSETRQSEKQSMAGTSGTSNKKNTKSTSEGQAMAGTSGTSTKNNTKSTSYMYNGLRGIGNFAKFGRTREIFMTFKASNETVSMRLYNALKMSVVEKSLLATDFVVAQQFVYAYVMLNKLVIPEEFKKVVEDETGSTCIQIQKVVNRKTLLHSLSIIPVCYRHNMDDLVENVPVKNNSAKRGSPMPGASSAKRQKLSAKSTATPPQPQNLDFLRCVMSDEDIAKLQTPNGILNTDETTSDFLSNERELQGLTAERDRVGTMVNTLEKEIQSLEQQLRHKMDELKKAKTVLETTKTRCLTLARDMKASVKKSLDDLKRKEQLQQRRLDSIRYMADDDSQLIV